MAISVEIFYFIPHFRPLLSTSPSISVLENMQKLFWLPIPSLGNEDERKRGTCFLQIRNRSSSALASFVSQQKHFWDHKMEKVFRKNQQDIRRSWRNSFLRREGYSLLMYLTNHIIRIFMRNKYNCNMSLKMSYPPQYSRWCKKS